MSSSKDRRMSMIIVFVLAGLVFVVLAVPGMNLLRQDDSIQDIEEKEERAEKERRPPEEFHVDVVSKSVYNPAMLNIQIGDTVTWTNIDSEVHTVSSANFHDTLLPDEIYSVIFDTPGTYFYSCLIKFHGMTGIIRVS